MKKATHRLLATLLSICMVLTLLPVMSIPALAAPADYTLYFKEVSGSWNLYKGNTTTVYDEQTANWSVDGNTLKLNNFNFSTTAVIALSGVEYSQFKIELTGDNTIVSTYSGAESTSGIRVSGTLEGSVSITGNGSLAVTGGTSTSGGSYGIVVGMSVSISGNAVVTATGGEAATNSVGMAGEGVHVSGNAVATAVGGTATGNSYGVSTSMSFGVSGGSLTAIGNTSALSVSGYENVPAGSKYYVNTTTAPSTTELTSDGSAKIEYDHKYAKIVFVADTAAPTVSDKTITISSVTDTSLTLGWSKATDDLSAAEILRYVVYRKADSDFTYDADGLPTGGTVVGSGKNIGTYNVTTGLTAGTTYYFTVVVQDDAYNRTAYTMVSQTMDNAPLGGSATITGTNAIGQTLTAGTSSITGGSGAFSYQWQAGGTNVGTNSTTYTLTGTDAGKTITCVITRADATGSVTATLAAVVPYNIVVSYSGNDTSDTVVTLSPATGIAGATITLNYVLGGGSPATANNTLTFTGATGLTNLAAANENTTQNYTVTAADAVNGVITITATFLHTDLTPDPIAFTTSGNITKVFGDANFTNAITTAHSGAGAITYTSSDTAVATVNASTGVVAIVGAGATTITATKAEDLTYAGATASYILTVNNADQAAPSVGKTDETTAGANDGTITGVTTAMEYKLSTDILYIAITGTSITGLAPGTYNVRYAAKTNHNAGADATITIAAYAAPTIYNITFDANGGSVTPTSAATGTDGKLTSLPTPTRSSYTFNGWFTATTGGTQVTTSTVFAANDTVYAQWTYKSGSSGIFDGGSSGSGSGSTDKPTDSGSTGSTVTEPEQPTTPEVAFGDVSVNDWFYEDVKFVVERGLFNGTGNGNFSPNSPMTRAMVFTVLARLAGVDTTGGETWYSLALAWGIENGLTDGSNPNGNVSREQLVTLLWRYAGEPSANAQLDFADAGSVNSWAADAMAWAVEVGIIRGNGNGALNPQGDATRAEVAAILRRFVEDAE